MLKHKNSFNLVKICIFGLIILTVNAQAKNNDLPKLNKQLINPASNVKKNIGKLAAPSLIPSLTANNQKNNDSIKSNQPKSITLINIKNKKFNRFNQLPLITVVNRAAFADAEALIELANRFEYGSGVKINFERAYQIYCQAARLGSVRAQIALARIYLEGKIVIRNHDKAHAWLMQAARSGDQVATAILRTTSKVNYEFAQCEPGPPVRGFQPLPDVNNNDRKNIQALIYNLAPNYGLDPNLVLTIAELESNFNSMARSSKNAQGVMQLIPETAERFGVRDIYDPIENIKGGMAYLRWLMSYFKGDVRLVAAAYNAGEGAVDKYSDVPPYAETQNYVEQVMRRYNPSKNNLLLR